MELCNASLDQVFVKDDDARKYRGPMPLNKENILLQLANGMKYIHDNKLVYMKAKPRNVLIYSSDPDSPVLMKWADFGLSDWFLDIFDVDGMAWLPPEIVKAFEKNHQPSSPRNRFEADIYSEGLVFIYILLDGEYPIQTYRGGLDSSDLEGNK